MSCSDRLFHAADYLRPSDGEPFRSVVRETAESVIVVWHVRPGQTLPVHVHPHGQDTWTVLAGRADYLAGPGRQVPLAVGDIAVATAGEWHGAINTGDEDFVFVSVVAPGTAGYQRIDGAS